jgi:hypothetical protein
MATDQSQTRLRAWLGVVVAAVGVVLVIVGWYKVSGEADVGRQMPYVVSACLPGAALLVAGAVLIAAERWRDAATRTDERVDALYALFTEPAEPADAVPAPPPTDPAVDGHLVTVDGTTRYHRAACPLVAGKAVHDVAATEVNDRHLEPCPVCDPPAPAPA